MSADKGRSLDVLRSIQAANAGRDPERLRLKYQRMAGSAFAFMRGSCHLFYERLPLGGVFKSAPPVWVCGDLHLENFGSYKGDNRLVYFDINDFDEAALAPASWELVRLLCSLWVGAEVLGTSRAEARHLCAMCLGAYTAALAAGKAGWVERDTVQGPVRALLDGLRGRSRAQWLAQRTKLTQRRGRLRELRKDGKKALPASAAQRAQVEAFMAEFAKAQDDVDFYQVLDVARRIAGTGSLGLERYVILVQGKGSPDANYLLDLKVAQPSSLTPHLKLVQPRWPTEAHRVVAVQQRMQAVSNAFLHAVVLDERACVLRGLQPAEDRVTLDRRTQTLDSLQSVLQVMGRLVAWAQLRSSGRDGSASADELIDYARREKWKAKLLDAAEAGAVQVRRDAAVFKAAYDAGALTGAADPKGTDGRR